MDKIKVYEFLWTLNKQIRRLIDVVAEREGERETDRLITEKQLITTEGMMESENLYFEDILLLI